MNTPNRLCAFFLLLGFAHAEIATETEILKTGGPWAEVIVSKAHDQLLSAQAFASSYVGAAGQPTSSCWALTVIVLYDPKAQAYFESMLSQKVHPASKLYAAAGLIALDARNKELILKMRFDKAIQESKVYGLDGCSGGEMTFEEHLTTLLEVGPRSYLYRDNLPSLYETIDIRHE